MVVDLPSSPLAEVDPEFEKLAVEGAAFTFGLPGTSLREKLLQNLAADVCRSQMGLAFRMHVSAATMHGIRYADLKAVIRFIAPYSGYPAAADALATLKQIAAEIDLNTADLGDHPAAGTDSPGQSLNSTDEWMTKFLEWQTARAWSETRLSRRERAILAITCDISQQALEDTFRLHIKLALDAGLSKDGVRDVVRYCAEHGMARSVAALRELDTVLETFDQHQQPTPTRSRVDRG